jgi:hypothetical protein
MRSTLRASGDLASKFSGGAAKFPHHQPCTFTKLLENYCTFAFKKEKACSAFDELHFT